MNLVARIERRSQALKISLGFSIIGAIGVVDYLTGYEFSFSLFYVIPIAFVTWLMGERIGIIASFAGALVWLGADVGSGHLYSHPFLPVWNSLIRFSFFFIITLLLSRVRAAMEREKDLARTDSLTGAVNSRHFFDMAEMEIHRSKRYERPFSLVYMDLDNFKSVNDQLGHLAGDQVLRAVVSCAKRHLRTTDIIARLGGDEFALLLPEARQESARAAISKLQKCLLEEMRQNHWSITFSIGVITCNTAPPAAEDLVRMADELMYSVKRDGKNAISYANYPG